MSRKRETAQKSARMVMIAICTVAAGCSSVSPNLANYDAEMTGPLSPDQARVCFVRQSAMLGAIVPHSVLDCGANVAGDVSFIETSRWVPASSHTVKQLFSPEEALGTALLEGAAGREIAKNKPLGFTIGHSSAAVQPNTDLMDAAYLAAPQDLLQRMELSGTQIVTGKDYLWFVSDEKVQPRVFVRLPGRGSEYKYRSRRFTQITGPEAIDLMAQEIGMNALYVGTVRSGGSTTFDRPEGTMQLRVVSPGGDTAFAPDFPVKKGKKYVVVYTYGFSGVNFAISERPQ